MHWFSRHYGQSDYRTEFDTFKRLFAKLKAPRAMLMLMSGPYDDQTVYITLPEARLSRRFPQFTPAKEPEGFVTGLVGHQLDLDRYDRR